MKPFFLPPQVQNTLKTLENAGYESYVVGGCVRDMLMGIEPHDYDITTAATPEEVKNVFASERLILTGEKHGTVTLLKDGMPLEITAFRCDGDYLDGRHPSSVTFTRSLEEDLKRRDLTINAMAYSPAAGLRDLFGGREDLANGIVRCVGDPKERYDEDALRLLRTLRFAVRFGFSIEPETAKALHEKRDDLQKISRERVREEMTGILMSDHILPVCIDFADVLFAAVPELAPMKDCPQQCIFQSYDVWEHTLRTVMACPKEPVVRWAGLLHDIGKPATRRRDENGADHFYGHAEAGVRLADSVTATLRMPKAWQDEIRMLVRRHDEMFTPDDMLLLLSEIGPEKARSLVLLHVADQAAHSPLFASKANRGLQLIDAIDQLEREGACWQLSQLAVTGGDLQAIGLSGPAVGDTLRYLLEAVVRFHVPNDHDLLLEAAKAHKERTVDAFRAKES
ncbi:MAG: HDIG domain-containing protein [Clostridia bacterium]|nr:HDIG domain-containing protein [Clostridia bacterium]